MKKGGREEFLQVIVCIWAPAQKFQQNFYGIPDSAELRVQLYIWTYIRGLQVTAQRVPCRSNVGSFSKYTSVIVESVHKVIVLPGGAS